MIYFVSYDISNPDRLKKVVKITEDYGLRIQYSFFQVNSDKERISELTGRLLSVIDKKEDSLIVIPICSDCSSPIFKLGTGSLYNEESFQIL